MSPIKTENKRTAYVKATPKAMKRNLFLLLKVFRITIFQLKEISLHKSFHFSSNILLPAFGTGALIDSAGEIFNISFAPQSPDITQKKLAKKSERIIYLGYI